MPPPLARESIILGSLFLRRGRTVNRLLAMSSGAIVTLALCGLMGLAHFLGQVGSVADHRDLGVDRPGGCIRGSYRFDPIGLEQYETLLVSARCPTPEPPPGLPEFPKPGQVFLSPALAGRRATDPRIADRYPHVSGVIDRSGLTGSNEMRAIIGVAPSRPDTVGVSSFDAFGAPNNYLSGYLRIGRGTLMLLGVFFTVPASAVLISACARLNARVRERQLRVLGVLGVRGPALRGALVFEAAVLVGIGATIGALLAIPLLAKATPHFAAWTAFPGDYSAPKATYLVVLLAVLGTAIVASWWGSGFWRPSQTGHTIGNPRRVVWRWTLLVAGLALAEVATWWRVSPSISLAGQLITAAGLIAVAAPLCASAGRRLSRSPGPLNTLAGARLRRPSGTLTRSLGAFVTGLFVMTMGITTIQGRGEDPAALARAQSPDGYTVVEVRRPNTTVRAQLNAYQALSGRTSRDGKTIATVSGPCAAIRQVIGAPGFRCPTTSLVGVAPGDGQAPTGVEATPVPLPGPRADVLTDYVVTVTDTSAIRDGDDVVLIPLPTAAADSLYDHLVGADPLTNVRISGSATVSGASELIAILDVFRWGAMFAVTLAFIAVLICLVSLMTDRQPGNNYLQILGLSPRRALAVTVTEIMTATGACATLALFASWLWALAGQDHGQPLDVVAVATPYLMGVLALLGAATVVVWNSLRSAGVTVVPDRDNLASAHDTFAPAPRPRPASVERPVA